MSLYKVKSESLRDIADAIREKGGAAGPITFPGGFIQGIDDIETGVTPHIYGVLWAYGVDANHNNQRYLAAEGTRTDDAADFAAPVPSVGGSAGSSPFDTLLPWSGMVVSQDQIAGALVAIPRFWYKWTKTASFLKLQIADAPVAGFTVSPAHADRGDGKGERETVYVARYKCAGQTAMSVSEASPVTGIPRDFLRTLAKYGADMGGQHVTPSDFGLFQLDYSMYWTIRMLMLVEYGTWNLQEALGYGCGAEGGECDVCHGTGTDPETGDTCANCDGAGTVPGQEGPLNTGTTDDMPYHTGTVQASLDTYGQGIQYRWIEDMWAGCAEWIDGLCTDSRIIGFDDRCVYAQPNPLQCADYPMAAENLMDEADENWAEWVAANVDLVNNSFDGDDPSEYFDSETMQAIGAYCAQNTTYSPEYGNLGGKIAVCVSIAGTMIFRKRISLYTLSGADLLAKTEYCKIAGAKIRAVLNLSSGSMYGEDENGDQSMSQNEMFIALIGSGTIDAIKIGKCMSGSIVDWTIPEQANLGWALIPVGGNYNTSQELSVADNAYWYNPSFYTGAAWDPYPSYGPFFVYSFQPSTALEDIGARLQKLP